MTQLDLSKPAIGSWCQIGHPAGAEILARAGFSWVAADAEHGELEDADIAVFCRAVRAAAPLSPQPSAGPRPACVPLVRVKENAVLPIRRALDLGSAGVIVPLVNTAEEAERAVKAAYYPPRGIRGFAFTHANNWGADLADYVRDFKPVVIVMIESKTAVENLDAIASVEGVDGCFVGPYDLSGSYGIPGQTGHELIIQACARVSEVCGKHGKAAGQHIITPTAENVARAIKQGFTFIALGMDTYFITDGARRSLEMLKAAAH